MRFEGVNNVHSLTSVPMGERSSLKETPELGVGALKYLYKWQIHRGQFTIPKNYENRIK